MVQSHKAQTEKAHQEYKIAKDKVLTELSAKMDEHKIPLEELFTRLKVDPKVGLSQEEAAKRNKIYGPNVQYRPKKKKAGCCFLFLSKKAKEEKMIEELERVVKIPVVAKRDGKQVIVAASDLTVGDIIQITEGERVPADVRVIFAQECAADNVEITQDHEPVKLSAESSTASDLSKASNFIFMKSKPISGQAECIVVRVGDQTVASQIQIVLEQSKQKQKVKKEGKPKKDEGRQI